MLAETTTLVMDGVPVKIAICEDATHFLGTFAIDTTKGIMRFGAKLPKTIVLDLMNQQKDRLLAYLQAEEKADSSETGRRSRAERRRRRRKRWSRFFLGPLAVAIEKRKAAKARQRARRARTSGSHRLQIVSGDPWNMAAVSGYAEIVSGNAIDEDTAVEIGFIGTDLDPKDDVVSGMSARRKRRIQRRRARIKKFFKGIGKGKILKKLGGFVKKVLNSKFMKGILKVASFVPGYGQAINAAANLVNKAASAASRIGGGDKKARRAAATLALRGGASLAPVRQAFGQRFGGILRGVASRGSINTLGELQVVSGALALYGDNPTHAEDLWDRAHPTVAAGGSWSFPPLIRYGYEDDDPTKWGLRDTYRLGLQSMNR